MRYLGIILFVCGVTACNAPSTDFPDGFWEQRDGSPCPKVPDMTSPTPKCAAEKGLAGENLICVDFDKVTGLTDQKLMGWNFKASSPTDCWEVNAGKLQIMNFKDFATTCGLTLPAFDLNQSQYMKYNSLVLSVIHRVDINDPNQTAQMSLGSPIATRTFWSTTGKRERQQIVFLLNKTDPVPTATNAVYQYLLQITSAAGFPLYQGWQIESIAVNGTM